MIGGFNYNGEGATSSGLSSPSASDVANQFNSFGGTQIRASDVSNIRSDGNGGYMADIRGQIHTVSSEELKQMMADWNAQVVMPCGFSDFRDFSSWTSALDFTRMALNQEKYLDDFTWTELNDVINFIRKAEGSASDHSYALQLLEINFRANPLDLIYHPDCWFNDEALFHARLTTEEIGGYLMKKSGRWLNDAPDIQLVYAIPQDVYD